MSKADNTKPYFSILMSNYNNGLYVVEAIESVLKQSFTNWELIIIDDGSIDNSVNIIKNYAQDKRIKFFENKKNLGCPATLIKMMNKARADFIGILDSDDVLTRDALEIVFDESSNNHGYGFFYSKFVYCDQDLSFPAK